MWRSLNIIFAAVLLHSVNNEVNSHVAAAGTLSSEDALLQLYNDNGGPSWSWPYSPGGKVPWSTQYGHCRYVFIHGSHHFCWNSLLITSGMPLFIDK